MRAYSADDEQRLRMQDLVREWTHTGLLEASQGERLGAALHVDLRRTNPFLRAALALFTALIIAAAVGLFVVQFEVTSATAIAVTTALAALACLVAAEVLVARYRCYRFGVEESFAVAAVVLSAVSGAKLMASLPAAPVGAVNTGLIVGAAGAFGIYRRFGFVYAAVGSMACAAAIPFQFQLGAAWQRTLAAAIVCVAFTAARSGRRRYRDDFPGDEYGAVQAAALIGGYALLNVQLTPGWYAVTGWYYWFTYAVTWLAPLGALGLGLRSRDRELMDAGLLLLLITLLTNKTYLGWPRQTWDPILLGVVLIGAALGIRRWLSTGPGGERSGFTSEQVREADRAKLSMLGAASVLVQPGGAAPAAAAAPPAFGGGRSGGAGGGDTF